MQPSMLLKLLRKLTVDVSNLSEYTTVALRVCIYIFKCFIIICNTWLKISILIITNVRSLL